MPTDVPAEVPTEVTQAPELRHAFDESRRLTGANLYFGSPAVTLAPRGDLATDAAALERWAVHVRALCTQLHWPDPQPVLHRHAAGCYLVFRAPADVLLTATEVNEWAWERSLAAAGRLRGFDVAQPLGDGAVALLAARAAAERVLAAREAAAPPLRAVPTILVTGSNGKTSTVRLLAAIVRAAGLVSGHCSTEGVVIAGEQVSDGDWSGPEGARRVLRDPRVGAAVLETARGGILRRGLAVGRADVAIVTNISADHFGEYGIDSNPDLARVKLVVARALEAGGTLVLNGADEVLMAEAAALPHAAQARQALFALDAAHPRLQAHRAAGGATAGMNDGHLTLHLSGAEYDLGGIARMPLTLGGAAPHNIENLAAAALAAACIGWPLDAIRATLAGFGADPADNPGRLERHAWQGATVLVDYAHNPDGLAKLLAVARSLRPQRLTLLLGQAGNRDDAALRELARVACDARPDLVVLKELPAMLRGRASGEVTAVLQRELLSAGLPAARIALHADEAEAALTLLRGAAVGDVVVLPLHESAARRQVLEILTTPGAGIAAAPRT